ncbi:MAG: hypothetical protein ACOYPS_01260 [Phycisphaerales bacterium]|jgi:hypothetical protein
MSVIEQSRANRNADAAGGKPVFGMETVPAGDAFGRASGRKFSVQSIVMVLVVLVSAVAVVGMRAMGTRGGIAMGNDEVQYTAQDADVGLRFAKVMGDLARVQRPLDVALGEFGRSPFMIRSATATANASTSDMTPEQRAEKERRDRQETRRRQIDESFASLTIQSIIGGRVSLARISGDVYSEGDVINGLFKVVSIEDRTVHLEADGQRFELTLLMPQAGGKDKTPRP